MENNEKKFGRDDRNSWKNRDNRSRRSFGSRERSFNKDAKSFGRDGDGENTRPSFNNGERRSFRRFDDKNSENRDFKPRRSFGDKPRFNDGERKPFKRFNDENSENKEFRPRREFNGEERPRRSFGNKPRFNDGERRSFRRFDNENVEEREFKPRREFDGEERPRRSFGDKPRFNKSRGFKRQEKTYENPMEYTSIDKNLISRNFDDEWNDNVILEDFETPEEQYIEPKKAATEAEGYRLNRFISVAGVCSRRAADDYIAAGKITVNGKVVTDFSTRIFPGDEVCLNGKKLVSQKRVYIVFNKPKDCISTKSDELGRKTIYDYVKTDVEVKNVGRLDRDTTGVMLLTNDGDLMERLTHPRYNKMKIYHVFLDKNLSAEHFAEILDGVDLDPIKSEDGSEIKGGHIDIDDLQYVEGEKNQIGIQLHSGMYHVVRRIFEKYGYKVEKLDRVYFAGLTKKDLPRGHWRYLSQKEVAMIKRGAYA